MDQLISKQRLVSILKSKNGKNAGWIIGEQIFQMVLSFIVGILSARYLGPSYYGALNYTASFVSFCICLVTLGMDGVVIKRIIAEPEKEGEYLGSCMLLRFFSSLLSSLAILILIYVLNPGDTLKLQLAALQTIQLLFLSIHILNAWFQRHLKSKYVSIAKGVAGLVVSGYKITLLLTAKDVTWFAFSNSLSYIIIAIILIIAYKKENTQRLSFKTTLGVDVLKDSYHFILADIMVAIYGQIDKIMIGNSMTDADVGYYTTAAGICAMWLFIPQAIITSFRPTIMELKQSGDEKAYLRRLEQLYSFIIWLCIGVSLIISVIAPYLILVLFGKAYAGATPALAILIWSEVFSMVGSARSIWILSENKNKYVKYYLAIGAVINVVLNALLIPPMGIIGASIATLITQIVTCLIAPVLFKETRIHTSIVWDAFILKWRKNG